MRTPDRFEEPRSDHPEPGCANCGHRSDCGKVTRLTGEQMEELYENARGYARAIVEVIPPLGDEAVSEDDLLDMLANAYMSGVLDRPSWGTADDC